MIVKRTYMITIATLSDWLENLAPVFQPMRRKNRNHSFLVRVIFRARFWSYRLLLLDGSPRCLLLLRLVRVIFFGIGFTAVILKTALICLSLQDPESCGRAALTVVTEIQCGLNRWLSSVSETYRLRLFFRWGRGVGVIIFCFFFSLGEGSRDNHRLLCVRIINQLFM